MDKIGDTSERIQLSVRNISMVGVGTTAIKEGTILPIIDIYLRMFFIQQVAKTLGIAIAQDQGTKTLRFINDHTMIECHISMASAAEVAAVASSPMNMICPRSDLAAACQIIREMAVAIQTQG